MRSAPKVGPYSGSCSAGGDSPFGMPLPIPMLMSEKKADLRAGAGLHSVKEWTCHVMEVSQIPWKRPLSSRMRMLWERLFRCGDWL
jgi:hypothetical protein